MKISKIFIRITAFILVLLVIVPTFASCADKADRDDEQGSGKKNTSKDTKVNTLTGEIGADLMEGFYVGYWAEKARQDPTGEYYYTSKEGKSSETFEKYETVLEEGGMLERFCFLLKEHAKTYNKSLKKITFTIEADRDTSLYLQTYVTYDLQDKVYQKRIENSKALELKANEPMNIELTLDMEDSLEGEATVHVIFQQDESGEVEHESWQEWHLTNYKITDLKVIAK